MLNSRLAYKIDTQRRLCLKKDLIELSQWISAVENYNRELDYLGVLEKQLVRSATIAANMQGLRRKNTLTMGLLYKYEQQLKSELEYGDREYDLSRAKEHEKKRDIYGAINNEFIQLKIDMYKRLSNFKLS